MQRYRVGIDLGTSNTVVAYAAHGDDRIELLPIEQLVGAGQVHARPLLPSLRYHAAPGELRAEDLQLPWSAPPPADAPVVGSYARNLGAQVPGRLVASAKSWLSHPGVDRAAPILPWGGGDDVAKVSPVDASASYLAHVRAAWNARFPDALLERQDIVLTVPASFDEGARALTLEAARRAGLPTPRLVEEPQAACYDWLFRHRRTLAAELEGAKLILVCDVGGGTTDFTLIRVDVDADGEPRLARIGVGDHLMLGGDNMDLALAHLVESRLGEEGGRLSAARFSQLVQRCRDAKERLLAPHAPDRVAVMLPGAGSRLIGGARSVELAREEVERLIVDGFLPDAEPDERPARRRAGIVEFGLPYPADPAISRHLAAFLDRHAGAARAALGDDAPGADALPVPDTVLLNGGVFRAAPLADRLRRTLGRWRGESPRLLHNDDPDVAVARGAVAYALVRAGQGPRIGGGSARSYFLVVDDTREPPLAVCVLPRGTEEGRELPLPERIFALKLGQPVQFHLVSSAADAARAPGDLVDVVGEDFVRLPPIATVLPGDGVVERPVRLVAAMTEVGTLEMHCVDVTDPAQRWLLPFELRNEAAAHVDASVAQLPARFADAVEAIDRVFGSRSREAGDKDVRQLRGQLDHLLGDRDGWDLPLARALFDALWERAKRRRRSAAHERLWLNLAGYCLRPGFGFPLDDWRIGELWSLFEPGLQYVRERQNWSEWWTLWRRAAGGLGAERQLALLQAAGEQIEADEAAARARRPVGARGSFDDLMRLAASLERVEVAHRVELGDWLVERLQKPQPTQAGWWALGRLGAREPLYGSAHHVVPPDVAERWLAAVLALDWKQIEPAAFAAAQLARMTGDRSRDLPQPLRDDVARRLDAAHAPPSWSAMVRDVVVLEEAEKWRAFGESLPAGLQLLEG